MTEKELLQPDSPAPPTEDLIVNFPPLHAIILDVCRPARPTVAIPQLRLWRCARPRVRIKCFVEEPDATRGFSRIYGLWFFHPPLGSRQCATFYQVVVEGRPDRSRRPGNDVPDPRLIIAFA